MKSSERDTKQTIFVIGSDTTKSLKVRKTNIKYTGAARGLLGVPEFSEPPGRYLSETMMHLNSYERYGVWL